mgnify:CR=1 FL=1
MHNIEFGMDGPIMSGTWVNPKTGHKFTVKDTYFEDTGFKIMTTAGQILDYSMIENYVQENLAPGEKPVEWDKVNANNNGAYPDLPPEIANELLTENTGIYNPLDVPLSTGNNNENKPVNGNVSNNYTIIDKALSKYLSSLKFDLILKDTKKINSKKGTKFEDAIAMLIHHFDGIKKEEIIDYIVDNSLDKIKQSLKRTLK